MIYRLERTPYKVEGHDLPKHIVNIEHTGHTEQGLKNLKDYKPSPMYRQEDFNRMSYKERVQLKKDFPEEYERLNGRGEE